MNNINDLVNSVEFGLMTRWSHEVVKLLKYIKKIALVPLIENQRAGSPEKNPTARPWCPKNAFRRRTLPPPLGGSALTPICVLAQIWVRETLSERKRVGGAARVTGQEAGRGFLYG